jgi:hypothetical protein
MTGDWWSDDDELLVALGEALRSADDVPRRFVEAGMAAYAWHNIDAELAALTYDSATPASDRVPALTRAEPASLRALTFASARMSIHLEVTRNALHGQVVPAQPGEIELRPVDGDPVSITIDEVGWFVIQPIPAGAFTLRCRTADGSVVLTNVITL